MNTKTYINHHTLNIINSMEKANKKAATGSIQRKNRTKNIDAFLKNENITEKYEMITYKKNSFGISSEAFTINFFKELFGKVCDIDLCDKYYAKGSMKRNYGKNIDYIGKLTFQYGNRKIQLTDGYLPNDVVDDMNSDGIFGWYSQKGDTIQWREFCFTKASIPSISDRNPSEVKAVNNELSFNVGKYFKYVTKSGKEYYLKTYKNGIGTVNTENLRGIEYPKEVVDYQSFWNGLLTKNADISEFSHEDIKAYLKNAGIEKGFFTINMQKISQKLFYSDIDSEWCVRTEKQYNKEYEKFTTESSYLKQFQPGSVFKINNKEYTLENGKGLDIPYGEDVFAIDFSKAVRK